MSKLSTAACILLSVSLLLPTVVRGVSAVIGINLPLANEADLPYSGGGVRVVRISEQQINEERREVRRLNQRLKSQEDRTALLAGAILASAWLVAGALPRATEKP